MSRDIRQKLNRFAQFAVMRIGFGVAARFRVEQDGLDDFLHLRRIRPIVIENRRDASDKSRCRIARDKLLNQKSADKRRDVRMIINIIQTPD